MARFKKWLVTGSCAVVLGFGLIVALPAPAAYAGPADPCAGGGDCNRFVENYINPMIMLLSGLIGVAAVISIVVAGIQYSSSSDDPGAISKAKRRIFQTVIGLLAYVFLLAFLNYLVPGGVI